MEERFDFQLFTSIRYDVRLIVGEENQAQAFVSPCCLYMLRHHVSRMKEAAGYFQWPEVIRILEKGAEFQADLERRINIYRSENDLRNEPLKVKILFSQDGHLEIECGVVGATTRDHLYPSTLMLPSSEAPATFTPSPLTGGAMHAGPTTIMSNTESQDEQSGVSNLRPSYLITIDTTPTKVNPHLSLKTTWRPHYDEARSRCLPSITSRAGLENKEVLLYNEQNQIMEASLTTPYFFRGGRWVTPKLGFEHGGQIGTTRRWALKQDLCEEEDVLVSSIQDQEKIWLSNGVRGFHWGYVEVKK